MHHTLSLLPPWIWHPLGQCAGTHAEVLRCEGYNFWSGIFSDLPNVTFLTGLFVIVWRTRKRFECHVERPKNCHRIGWPVAGTANRACRTHHPHAAERGSGITEQHILEHHEESGVR